MADRLGVSVGDVSNRWAAAMSPRKWRTFPHADNFQPSWLYRQQMYRPSKPDSNWIGKYFIPDGSIPARPHVDNYVLEYDVMRKSGMYNYRILYAVKAVDETGWVIRSKAAIEGRPGQMNIILTPQNLILDVQYW